MLTIAIMLLAIIILLLFLLLKNNEIDKRIDYIDERLRNFQKINLNRFSALQKYLKIGYETDGRYKKIKEG